MEFEIVGETPPEVGDVFKSNYDSDEFFRKFVDKNGYIRITEWRGGLLYSTPGNVLGLILSKEVDTSGWKISLSWTSHKKGDAICVYRKKGEDDKFWCIQNDYLEHVSELTGKKELTIKHNYQQIAIIEYNRWLFVIAPVYMEEKDLKWGDEIDFKEVSSVSLDDLW